MQNATGLLSESCMGCLQCKQMPTIEEELTDADPGLNKMDEQGEQTCKLSFVLLRRPAPCTGLSKAPAGLHCTPVFQVMLMPP